MTIEIRQVNKVDEQALVEICYITGDNTLKRIFPDPYLFSYFWCLYYLRHEPEGCFVAVDNEKNKVIGYIMSTSDTINQEEDFIVKMKPLIKLRMKEIKLRTLSSRIYAHFIIHKSLSKKRKKMLESFPAHLHINILPNYQRQGIGYRLMQSLEKFLKENNIQGFHLEVGAKNTLGINFYTKYGLESISKNRLTIIYAKKLM